MSADVVQFFRLQRHIFGVCPHSGQVFRLSDCRVYLKTKPARDWLDRIEDEAARLDKAEERLDAREEDLREQARERGRQQAQRTVRKVDRIFGPRHLNADDAKVVFHPLDYVVFDGMKKSDEVRRIVLLDQEATARERRPLQRSIEQAIDRQRYEWLTLRVGEDGTVSEE